MTARPVNSTGTAWEKYQTGTAWEKYQAAVTPSKAPETVTITRREYDHLRDRVHTLERRCGALMVDADRREEKARLIAGDCAEHGKEITYLRHIASWYWAAMNHADECRQAVVRAISHVTLSMRDRTEMIEPADLVRFLDRILDAQQQVSRRPPGYPSLADCLRGGGCDHAAISEDLKAEIAETLGLTAGEAARKERTGDE